MCFGNISKDFAVDNMKEVGLNGYVFFFLDSYESADADNTLDVHKYLTKKNNIKYLDLLKYVHWVITHFHNRSIGGSSASKSKECMKYVFKQSTLSS